jgi:hypothetical protein
MLRHFPVLLLLIGLCSSADATVLCANQSGGMVVRDSSCKPGETVLDPVALGLQGPAGTPGANGADGVSGYEIATSATLAGSGAVVQLIVVCPAGKLAIGGGFHTAPISTQTHVVTSQPTLTGGWRVVVINGNPTEIQFDAYAVCATVQGTA